MCFEVEVSFAFLCDLSVFLLDSLQFLPYVFDVFSIYVAAFSEDV